nr:retrovirus-related Pol polyprotein from transposon TNT 1-94 [Tanacetum cinerariifolium]
GQFKNMQDITCWNCNQKGHFQNQCSKPVTSKDKEVNMVARDYDDALVCCIENMIDDRIMDSVASFHATYYKEELERFKLRFDKVCLADDKTIDIAGVRDVILKTSFGTSWTLKDVRFIPGLKKRLISIGQLDKEGYHVGFGDKQWMVTKRSLVVARGNKRGSLYMVEVTSDGINTSIDGRGNTDLLHQRLGHMSEKGMKILASKGRIPNLQKAVVGFCKPCVLGKHKKVSFVKSRNTRKLQRLELVHTDVYGPTSVASIVRSRYNVTFIDDISRKVKCLKCNNGGEYSSREFIEYWAENGFDMAEIKKLKRQLSQEFKMKDLGPTKQILGMSIISDRTNGTSKATLCFSRKEVVLEGFSNSDYEGCLDSGKSTTCYVFTVGGITVSWMSRIQKRVAMSTTKAEYMAIAEAGKELVWLKNFLKELDRAQTECVLFRDNQSAIHLAKNPVFHGRTKHIKIRYHYIRELVSEGKLSLKKILGAKNPAYAHQGGDDREVEALRSFNWPPR